MFGLAGAGISSSQKALVKKKLGVNLLISFSFKLLKKVCFINVPLRLSNLYLGRPVLEEEVEVLRNLYEKVLL